LPPPQTWRGRVYLQRHLLLRRLCQLGVLLAFVGTVRWGWTLAGTPLLRGDLSASTLFGVVPLADPFAVLQILFTRHPLELQVLLGAVVVLAFYAVVGGRSFCAWVCPVNVVTDLSAWLRKRWSLQANVRLPLRLRYAVLGLSLVVSAIAGVAAFEWVSPIGILQRGLLYGMGAGWVAVALLFVFDLTVSKHAWCGRLCPLGAFYALLGPAAQVRVKFDPDTCTHCGNCAAVCPEPQVLDLKQAARLRLVASGECTNCGGCIPVCPEDSLRFGLRATNP
jgi:ferredoxin-type protein NapH